ncbi:hypothetical protein KY327_01000 [Candidatus Woesearchaeota archaeon]|nr:hypothetical protein [Candidatus Woesearchaeota archaeon]
MTPNSPSRTKAQVSTLDFFGGLAIITVALLLASNLLLTMNSDDGFEDVKQQARTAAERLTSPGHPDDWNESDVIKAGILTDDRLNTTKLARTGNLTYDQLRGALAVTDHVYWYHTNATRVQNITACGHGHPSVTTDENCTPTLPNHGNLARIERLITHDDKILRMVVIAWD